MWPELTFPPLNLHNIYPSKEMAALHAKWFAEENAYLYEDTEEA